MPTNIAELLAFCGTHKDLWTTNQAQLGISVPTLNAFKALVDALALSVTAADNAREASKNATQKMHDNVAGVRALGQALIGIIRAQAETTNNPNVLVLGGIPPIAPPGPQPIPVAPTDFSAAVTQDGWIVVSWKASQPASGVQYQVKRRVNGEGEFTLLGSVGSVKKYQDKTLPFGVDSVQYLVTPTRNNIVGPSGNVFSLQFGVGDGLTIASAGESVPAKLAA